jgi:hypothetical protein
VVWPCGSVDGKERGRLSSGGIVGAWDVDRDKDEVVNVDIMQAAGVDWNIDDQLRSFTERDVIIEEDSCRY